VPLVRRIRLACCIVLLWLVSAPAEATLTLTPVAQGLAQPVDIQNAGDGSGRLFFVQQRGDIVVWKNGAMLPAPFLDVTNRVVAGGEQGLLGLAFHPDHRDNGFFFVNYTRAGDGATVVSRFRRSDGNPDQADASSEQVLLVIAQPYPNHNGGGLRFGPDGYLYIGMGDGGSANDPENRAQNLASLLGKMLRIDVDPATAGAAYGIPPDNPYAASASPAVRPEIWALGLRNPWRFSFDAATGDLYIGDVGQDQWEEIDFVPRGTAGPLNFGWRVMEGNHCTNLGGGPPCNDPGFTMPIAEYGHATGCSITGGFLYRGSAVPELVPTPASGVRPKVPGSYVYADFCSGVISALSGTADGGLTQQALLSTGMSISTFGEDEQRELYVADRAGGKVYRIGSTQAPLAAVVEFFNSSLNHYFMTASPAEMAGIDAGAAGPGWSRTGRGFNAFAAGAAGGVPVCRFYGTPGRGPNSHFFTADAAECAAVKGDPGWTFEGYAFSVLPAANAGCERGRPVYRAYNGRFPQNDSNHRYAVDRDVYNQMVALGWQGEGVVMCAAD
jgi:glucose/arabinose dehydrogenase